MSGQRRGSQSQKKEEKDEKEETGDKCAVCLKMVADKDYGLQCEICNSWHHIKCVDISMEVYSVLEKIKNVHWYCDFCNQGITKVIEELACLKSKHEVFEKQIDGMKEEMKEMRESRSKIEKQLEVIEMKTHALQKECSSVNGKLKEIDDAFQNTLESKLSSEVKKNVEQKVDNFREIMEQQLKDELSKEFMTPMNDQLERKMDESKQKLDEIVLANAEQEDIEARRNNLVFYKVLESNQPRADDRYKEDVDFCVKFLLALEAGVEPEDVKKVIRLGKRNDSDALPRPILVQLSSRQTKNMVTESLYKIKSLEAKFQRVIVSHDMTRKQREKCKELVAEAKRKSESGDFIYKVRGPPGNWRMIQIRKRD